MVCNAWISRLRDYLAISCRESNEEKCQLVGNVLLIEGHVMSCFDEQAYSFEEFALCGFGSKLLTVLYIVFET